MEASELPVMDEVNAETSTGSTSSAYVVQKRVGDEVVWEDIATINVPQRSKRRGVLQQALEEAGVQIEIGTTQEFRVLDAAAAEVLEVRNESVTKLVIE